MIKKSNNRKPAIKINITGKGIFIYIIFILILIGLFGRVTYFKVVKGDEFEEKSIRQQTNRNDTIIKPNRGSILDRNGQVMALSSVVYNVIFDASVLMSEKNEETRNENITKTITQLNALLGKSEDDIRKLLEKNEKGTYSQYYRLEKKISGKLKEEIEKENLVGITFERDSKRLYQQNSLASNIIGFMSGDNGSYGVEQKYNEYLKGTPGRSFSTYAQQKGTDSVYKEAEDGDTVSITIDASIQGFIETAIKNAMETTKPKNAAAIVMDPNTGEILAMASSPGFDLNNPKDIGALGPNADSMTEKEKDNAFFSLWRNYNISDTYEPGSTFKSMVVAAALEEGVITTEDTFYCSGSKQLVDGEKPVKCWKYPSGHGLQKLDKALANSCNPALMEIGAKLGRDLFYKYQRAFGFGEKTGVDLPGEESSINLLHPLDGINIVELATMSFGQGFNCTPLQLLNAFSSLINGGNLMKPYVVSQVVNSEKRVVLQNEPTIERKVISKETSDIMKKFLQEVVEVGTGGKVKIDGYTIGGKTSTAQQGIRINNEYVVSFVGFIPADNPQIIVLALIDRAEERDKATAAPMLKEILEKIITYKGIQPSTSIIDTTSVTKTVTLDDYTLMNTEEATTNISMQGLKIKVLGTGSVIINQIPKAGEVVEKDTEVILYLDKAKDAKTVKVPDLIGKTYDEAMAILNELGIVPVVEGEQEGLVITQEPKKDITVDVGGSIRIKFQK